MILAAGRGERLRPLTDSTPKPLVEVRGETLLGRHLRNIREAGISEVVINLGWLGEQIEARIGDGREFGLQVEYSREGSDILETGGGIHHALHLLGKDPFLVANADIYTDMPVPDVDLSENDLGHLVLVPTPSYRDHGDFGVIDGKIDNGSQPQLTFSGVAVYRPEFFAACEAGRFSIVPMLREAADERRLSGSFYDGLWADVGTPERLRKVNSE
jgi:MurNAc alpha-1-phosphate uridylyltransferase